MPFNCTCSHNIMNVTLQLSSAHVTVSNPDLGDAGENNIHIRSVDDQGSFTEIAQTTGDLMIRTSETGSPSGRMWVDYCAGVLSVYLSTSHVEGVFVDAKPSQPLLSANVDLRSSVNVEQELYVGYTSGKFGQADFHDIMSWDFVAGSRFCPRSSA